MALIRLLGTALAFAMMWFWWVVLAIADVAVLWLLATEPSQGSLVGVGLMAGLTWLYVSEADERPWDR